MKIKDKYINRGKADSSEQFIVHLTDPMLYDSLHTLSAEYSLSVEFLVCAAVKRLIGDVDFVRRLRMGKTNGV